MFADLARETSTTTGTGAFTLAGAVVGHPDFLTARGNGKAIEYRARNNDDPGQWEVGVGILTAGPPTTLSRLSVLSSSNAGGVVNFGPGTKDIICSVSGSSLLSRVLPKSTAYSVTPADFNALIDATGTWTLSLPAAAVLGNGWYTQIKNSGTGVITLDPNGAETINGQATLALLAGESALLVCNGAGWITAAHGSRMVIYWGGTTGNSGNAYTVTVSSPVPTAYTAGMVVVAVINAANTGTATINVNGLGAKAITKAGSTALAAGDLPAGAVVTLTYDGTQFQMSSGAGASSGGWTVASKTAAYTVGTADKSAFLMCTGTWTLSLTAAATLGAGFVFGVKNSGSGMITVDPNSSETINGQATLALGAGDTAMLICDGSGWQVMDSIFGGASPSFSTTTVYTDNGTFTVPAGVYRVRVRLWGGGGAGGGYSYSGLSGGSTSFGAVLSATGGYGGQNATSGVRSGGGGGGGSGGTVKVGGAGGSSSNSGMGGTGVGGGGGGAAAGAAGSGTAGASGLNGTPPSGGKGANGSAGAAGGATVSSAGAVGLAGSAGIGADSGGGGSGASCYGNNANIGGAGAAPGGGGGGVACYGGGYYYAGGGGGGGGYVEAVITVTPGTQYVITVGAGGQPHASESGAYRGGTGGSGKVIVEY